MASLFSDHKLCSLLTPNYLLILTLSTILLLIFIFPHKTATKTRSSNPNLPPSPASLPLLGHLHRLGSLPHRSLQKLSSHYGPIMYLRLGCVPTVVVSSASAAEQSVHFHDTALASRPCLTVADILMYGSSDVAFSPYGEYWRQARRISVLHLLSTKQVQSFGLIREQEVSLLIDKIRASTSGNGRCYGVVNLSQMLVSLTNDVVCRAALGHKYSADGSGQAAALLKEFIEHLGTSPVGEHVPCLSWVDCLTGLKRQMRKTAKGLDSFLENVIEEHVRAKRDASRDGRDGGSDLVDVLLNIRDNNKEIGVPVSTDNVKAIILDMFAAGTDSVYAALEWTMAELTKHPKEMKKVQDEIRGMISKNGKLTEELIEKMSYLNAAIKETFRLHPPLPLLVPRESIKDISLLGYHIPAGTRFIINAWAIGRDPDSWERADEFMPERFLGNNVDYRGLHFGLIPFGTGRRVCPGISFATTTIGFALASLLCHFDWDLPDERKGEPLDMSELSGITVHKKLNLVLVAKPHFV